MKALRKKLNSRRGASMPIALGFFVMCLVIGTIVLTTARSNAGRLATLEQNEQAYLTVSSAAVLIRDELEGLHFFDDYETSSVSDGPSAVFTGPVMYPYDDKEYPEPDKVLKDTFFSCIKNDAIAIFNDKAGVTSDALDLTSKKIEMTIKNDKDASVQEKMLPVTAVYQMDENYVVTIDFDIKGENTAHCPLRLTIACPKPEYEVSYRTEHWTTGESPDLHHHSKTFKKTTVNVYWQPGVITQGKVAE